MSRSAKFDSTVAKQIYELYILLIYIVHQGKPKRQINLTVTSVFMTYQIYQSC